VPNGAILYESAKAKRGLARFTGRELTLKVTVPGDRRLEIETGDGRDGARVRGYLDPSAVELVTRRALTVVPSQIWIEPGQRVYVEEATPKGLRVDAVITSPFEARFSAWSGCDSVAPGHPSPVRRQVGAGTPYLARVPSLVLYGAPSPSAGPVATLKPSRAFVLWGSERFRDFLRVSYSGAVRIDAWARAGDLVPVEPGSIPPESVEPRTLESVEAGPATPPGTRFVTTARAVTFFDAVDGTVIGSFEPATRLTVLRIVGSSASVLPIPPELLPLPNQEFWVASSDLEP
jgi:hypothetical protein